MLVFRLTPNLIKAIQGGLFADHPLSHLIPQKKVVTRGGKTHVQTFYVDPNKGKPKKVEARELLRQRGQLPPAAPVETQDLFAEPSPTPTKPPVGQQPSENLQDYLKRLFPEDERAREEITNANKLGRRIAEKRREARTQTKPVGAQAWLDTGQAIANRENIQVALMTNDKGEFWFWNPKGKRKGGRLVAILKPQVKEQPQAEAVSSPRVTPEAILEARKALRAGKLTVHDRYREAGLKRQLKGIDGRGEEIWGYPYTPDLFVPSDATGMPMRHYVVLSTGAKVHPDELERVSFGPDGQARLSPKEPVRVVWPNGKKAVYSSFEAAIFEAATSRKHLPEVIGEDGKPKRDTSAVVKVETPDGALSLSLPSAEWWKHYQTPNERRWEGQTFGEFLNKTGLGVSTPPKPSGMQTGEATQDPTLSPTSGDQWAIDNGRLSVGDTKTVQGVTYRLNENHRWERAEEPQAAQPEVQSVGASEASTDTLEQPETATPPEKPLPEQRQQEIRTWVRQKGVLGTAPLDMRANWFAVDVLRQLNQREKKVAWAMAPDDLKAEVLKRFPRFAPEGATSEPQPLTKPEVKQTAAEVAQAAHPGTEATSVSLEDGGPDEEKVAGVSLESPTGETISQEVGVNPVNGGAELGETRRTQADDYRDVGEKIGMARKDIAALKMELESGKRLALADLDTLEQDRATAHKLVTRDNMAGKISELAESYKAMGKSAGAVFLYSKVLSRIQGQPSEDSPAARKAFAMGVDRVIEALAKTYTAEEVQGALKDLQHEYRGFYVPAELQAQHQALKEATRAAHMAEHQHHTQVIDPLYQAMQRAKVPMDLVRYSGKWQRKSEAERNAELARLQPAYDQAQAAWMQAVEANNALEAQYKEARAAQDAFEAPLMDKEKTDPYSRRNVLGALGEKFLTYIGGEYNESARDTRLKDVEQAKKHEAKDDWSWLGKKLTTTRTASAERIKPFVRSVPEQLTRKGGATGKRYDSDTLMQTYGLRAVEYGNWMDTASSQKHTQAAGEALQDLAEVLGLPIQQVSFNGRLALAFGARGKGAVSKGAAHYETGRKVINLTKFAGGGSLAHEWGHFIDNVTAMLSYGGEGGESSYVSDGDHKPEGLNPAVNAAFTEVMAAIRQGDYLPRKTYAPPAERLGYYYRDIKTDLAAGKDPQAIADRISQDYLNDLRNFQMRYKGLEDTKPARKALLALNRTATQRATYLAQEVKQPVTIAIGAPGSHFLHTAKAHGDYESAPAELFARAFEGYISDKLEARGMQNTYLVAGASERDAEVYALLYSDSVKELKGFDGIHSMYPRGEERKRINAALDKLMEAMKGSQMFAKAAQMLKRRYVFRKAHATG